MFETFEHSADIGIRGVNSSLESAFVDVGKALFSVMVDLDFLKPEREVSFVVESRDLVGLLVDFLNELIFLRDSEGLFFCDFEVKIEENEKGYFLSGVARGSGVEGVDGLLADVKSATFYEALVEFVDGKFVVQCVLDV